MQFDLEKFNTVLKKLIEANNLAIENLTQQQFVEALRQMILSGDFKRFVTKDSAQQIVYIPYAREQELQNKIKHLEGILEANDIKQEEYQY